jgi:DNA-binding HxlR family transcriptional regulator
MLNRDYEGQNCSVARALEVVGERWSLLIVRDVFLGLRRFEELQQSLGIARNVLTDRLNRLVEEGVLERVRYSERPERFEYRLTRKSACRRSGPDELCEPDARGRGYAVEIRLQTVIPSDRDHLARRPRRGDAKRIALALDDQRRHGDRL